jgi:transcription initiation factor IIE alpha subunit
MSDYYTEQPLPLFADRAPSVNGSATSAAAADSLGPATLNAMQRRVYEFICRTPSTDEEIADELSMNPSTVRPRRGELARRGLIVEAGTRRTSSGRMAVIWKATAASR